MSMSASLSPKDPIEIIVITFDFARLAASVSAPVITAICAAGEADATPQAIVSGAAQVIGATVMQQIVGGQSGTTYKLRCQVDVPDGNRFVLSALLPVRNQ